MCHKLDDRFFERLGKMTPEHVCRRALVEYDPERHIYRLTALEKLYQVDYTRGEINEVGKKTPPLSVEMGLAILFYLMGARDVPIAGEWISEKELPGGVTFFRGPHAIPSTQIASHFEHNINAFKLALKKLAGEPIEMGDAAFKIRALPRVPMAVVFWEGDDEFGPECKILMDATIHNHLPLDVIFGLAVELARRLTGITLWQ